MKRKSISIAKYVSCLMFVLSVLCMNVAAAGSTAWTTTALESGVQETTIVDSGTCGAQGDNTTWTLDSEGTLVISGTGAIAEDAFERNDKIKTLIINEGITEVGEFAFDYCTSITSITFPDSLTKIARRAFFCCTGLTEIDLPEGVTEIGDYSFADSLQIETVAMPISIRRIGIGAFSFCNALTTVDFYTDGTAAAPAEDAVLGGDAFYSCSRLTSIHIPDGVTSIGVEAFYGCTALTEVHLPDSLEILSYSAFEKCSALNAIDIPDGVTEIDKDTFSGCTLLKTVELPAKLASIGNRAFYQCSSLASVTFPNTLTALGDNAFRYCSTLKQVVIPAGVTLGGQVFGDCTGLTAAVFEDGHTTTGEYTFNGCTALTSVAIPAGVTEIAEAAFANCRALKTVKLPEGVINIRGMAFYKCSGLADINIPDGVEYIGDSAFKGCSALTGIDLPDSVTGMSTAAFADCDALSEFTVPAGMTWINSKLFYDCDALTTVNLHTGVTGIGSEAFYGCDRLTTITPLTGVTVIESGAFRSCKALSEFAAPAGLVSIGDSAFRDCISLTEFTIPSGVSEIAGYTFNGCSNLASVVIPASVTSIGESAFSFSGLVRVEIPVGVTTIGSAAFSYCPVLTSVVIPQGVTVIENSTFAYCSALTQVVLPEGLTTIRNSVFRNCTKLNELTIPESVTAIGTFFLYECPGIEWIYFATDATSIGDFAFFNCASLTDIYFAGSEEQWTAMVGSSILSMPSGTIIHYGADGPVPKPKTVMVTFDAGQGTGTMDPVEVTKGDVWTVPECEFAAPAGKQFAGWDFGDTWYLTPGCSVAFCEDMNLVAVWEDISYPIVVLGGTAMLETGVSTAWATMGTVVTLSANAASADRIFDKWIVTGAVAADENSAVTTFTMPACSVTAEAIYKDAAAKIGIPTITVTNRASDGKPTISWNAVEGATGYQVYRADSSGGTYKLLYTAKTDKLSVTHTGAVVGNDYFYKVRAIKDNEKGEFSKVKGVWCDLKQPTITVTNRASDGKPTISWKAVEGATGYQVYRADSSGGTYKLLYTAKADKLSVTHTGAVVGNDYFYKVKAVYGGNSKCDSAYSAVKGVWCDLKQPTITVTNRASDGKPTISWKAVEGATGYQVYRADSSGGTYKLLYTAKADKLSVTHTGAVVGNDYFYKVKAVYGGNSKCDSAYSAAKGVWCDLARPTLSVTLNAKGKPVLSWNKVTGATGYQIYRSTDGESWTRMYTAKADKLSVIHTGAVSDTTYYYKLYAEYSTNTKSNSAYSAVKTITAP